MDNYRVEENKCKDRNCDLCKKFAKILGAEILVQKGDLCTVTFNRNLSVEILGRKTRSPLVLAALFSFEDMDRCGKTLNLGETVILPEEINDVITILRKNGIIVTALHNKSDRSHVVL